MNRHPPFGLGRDSRRSSMLLLELVILSAILAIPAGSGAQEIFYPGDSVEIPAPYLDGASLFLNFSNRTYQYIASENGTVIFVARDIGEHKAFLVNASTGETLWEFGFNVTALDEQAMADKETGMPIENRSSMLFTDKPEYRLGEQVAISINISTMPNVSIGEISLYLENAGRKVMYLGDLSQPVLFSPAIEGNYSAIIEIRMQPLAAVNFTVISEAELLQNETVTEENISISIGINASNATDVPMPGLEDLETSSGIYGTPNITIDKPVYLTEEIVNISLAVPTDSIIISTQDASYEYSGEATNSTSYIPLMEGNYTIEAGSGNFSSGSSFRVRARYADTEKALLIEDREGIARVAMARATEGKILAQVQDRLEVGRTYDVQLVLNNSPVKEMEIIDLHFNGTESIRISNVNESAIEIEDATPERAFAIDPSSLEYSYSTIKVEAKGQALYKCAEWGYDDNACLGEWLFVRELQPGEEYTVEISTADPAFAEVNISILTVQSYPIVGRTWEVAFTVMGTADLRIAAYNGTRWSNSNEQNDLRLLEIRCGDAILPYTWIEDGPENSTALLENFSCGETVYETSKVLTEGKHTIEFRFGNDVDYAFNDALLGTQFTDTSDTDFAGGSGTYTIVRGTGADSNVTLNVTDWRYLSYNLSGNFTSRVYDSGTPVSIYDKIAWNAFLPNGSDVVGYGMEGDAQNDVGVWYRNGSIGADLSAASLAEALTFTEAVRTYSLPAGFDRDDISGIGWDDDGSATIFAFFRNGTVISDTAQADLSTNVAFTSVSTYTIRAGFNISDLMAIGLSTDAGVAAMFFRNGSYVVSTGETAPFSFTGNVYRYNLRPGFDFNDIIGSTADRDANDMALFFRNGSYLSNSSSDLLGSNKGFDLVYAATYQSGINLTIQPNVTFQTRVSNDTVSWSGWSDVAYASNFVSDVPTKVGRYIQYRAIFSTPFKYITAHLNNVSINYTGDVEAPAINDSSHSINSSLIIGDGWVRLNVSITDNSGYINTSYFTINNANYSANISTYPYVYYDFHCTPEMAPANYTWTHSYANDSAGNYDRNDSVSLAWYCDAPPVILGPTIALNDSFVRENELVKLNATIYDASGIINSSIFTINDTNYTAFRNGNESFLNWTCLAEGVHSFNSVYANDSFGLYAINSTNLLNITCDTTAPDVLVYAPANSTWQLKSTVNFTYAYNDLSGLASGCELIINGTLNQTSIFVPANLTELNISTTLADGIYSWSINCTDNAGHEGTNDSLQIVKVDANAPVIRLIEPVNNTLNDTSNAIDFRFNITSEVADIAECSLIINGTANRTEAGPFSVGEIELIPKTLLNSNYNWSINCTDSNGFTGSSETFNITIMVINDITPPTINMISPENNTWLNYSVNITLVYRPSDATGIANCTLYINSTFNQSSVNVNNFVDNNFTINYSGEGSFGWDISCIDSSSNNNSGSSNFKVYFVDTQYPSQFSLLTPLNGTLSSNFTPTFVWELASELNFANYTLMVDDNEDFASPEYLLVSNLQSDTTEILSIGENNVWYWQVIARDMAGNERYSSQHFVYTTDTINPAALNFSINDTDYIVRSDAFLNFSANLTDANGIKNATLNSSLMLQVGELYSLLATPASLGCINDQNCTLQILVYDNVTNLNDSIIINIYIDDTSPIAGQVAPAYGAFNNTNSIFFNWTVEDNLAQTILCNVSIDGARNNTEIVYAMNGSYGNYSATGFNQGLHNWSITCWDQIPNYAVSTTYPFTIDYTAPFVNITSPLNNTYENISRIITFNYTVNDTYSGIQACWLVVNGSTSGSIDSSVTEGITQQFSRLLDNGYYNWTVSCTDEAGNTASGEYFNLTINVGEDVTGPLVSLAYPGINALLQNTTVNFTYIADDATGIDSCELILDGDVNQTCHAEDFFLGGFSLRKQINISENSNTNLTEYQIKVFVDTAVLIAEGKMSADCGDVRFTDKYNNLISYYMDENPGYACGSQATLFWVKVPLLRANANTSIFMYYNSSSASSLSNMTAVFTYSTPKPVYFTVSESVYDGTIGMVAYRNNTQVYVAGSSATLNAGETTTFTTGQYGGRGSSWINTTGPLAGGDSSAAIGAEFNPISWASKEFVFGNARGAHDLWFYSPFEAITISCYQATTTAGTWGTASDTATCSAGGYCNATAFAWTSGQSIYCNSTAPFLMATSVGDNSNFPVYPMSSDLWMISDGYAAVAVNYTNLQELTSAGANTTAVRNIAYRYGPTDGADGSGLAHHLIANTTSIGADESADGDGNENAMYQAEIELEKQYYLYKTGQYIAIAATGMGSSCSLVTYGGYTNQTSSLTGAADYPFPTKNCIGCGADVQTFIAGAYIACNTTFGGHWETTSGDESTLLGMKSARQYMYPEPTLSIGNEQSSADNSYSCTISNGGTSSFNVANISFGTHTWYVNCTDSTTRLNEGTSNPRNFTIGSPVNITGTSIVSVLDLFAGTVTRAVCNVTVLDEDGVSDIANVNATFYHNATSSYGSADNLNSHYTNSSCTNISSTSLSAVYECSFDLAYFAVNGTWLCAFAANDSQGYRADANTSTYVSELLALNVTEVIEYGAIAPGSVSDETTADIWNIGNVQIDLNVWGYSNDTSIGELAMNCSSGYIPSGWQRYNLSTPGVIFNDMQNMSGMIAGYTHPEFNLGKATSILGSMQTTYWRIYAPVGTRGVCNGTVVFSAVYG